MILTEEQLKKEEYKIMDRLLTLQDSRKLAVLTMICRTVGMDSDELIRLSDLMKQVKDEVNAMRKAHEEASVDNG